MEPTTSKSVYVIKNLEKDIEYTSILTFEVISTIALISFLVGVFWGIFVERLIHKRKRN